MITNSVQLSFKSVAEAPKYKDGTFKVIKIENVIIVKKGMVSGKPSIDMQCTDADGNKYLIFVTHGIMQMMAAACDSNEIQ